jgi:hypothetical protein
VMCLEFLKSVLGLIGGVKGESGRRDEVGITIVFGIGIFYDFFQAMVFMGSMSGLISVVSFIGVSVVFVVGAIVGEIIVIGEFLLMNVVNVLGEVKWYLASRDRCFRNNRFNLI